MTTTKTIVASGCAVWLLALPSSAHAYWWQTHSRMVEVAASVAQHPPELTQAEAEAHGFVQEPGGPTWQEFMDVVRQTPAKLGALRTGLPEYMPTSSLGATGLGVIPPGTMRYPFANDPDTSRNEAASCTVFPEDNLTNPNAFRIQDFRYTPLQSNKGNCGLETIPQPTGLADPGGLAGYRRDVALQKVLGWHAASIDDHFGDTVLWFRPTNTGVYNWFKEAFGSTIGRGLGAVIGLIACLGEAIFGDGCEADEILDDKYNPINYIDSWLPGFGDVRGDTYTGMWHFVQMTDESGEFNSFRGMLYSHAGPRYPGAFDITIMASADLSGLSMNAGLSDGVDFYAPFDEQSRNNLQWQAHTIGHLEFSPVQNLARYGWERKYVAGGSSNAEGLGWPLHALGDVVAPHHVVGTSSWGHSPCEDWVEDHLASMLPAPSQVKLTNQEALDSTEYDQRVRILIDAYNYWYMVRQGGIEATVINLATRTYDRTKSGWAYHDLATVQWIEGDKQEAENTCGEGNTGNFRGLLETGSSATLGFLMFAGERAVDPGPGANTDCDTTHEHFVPGLTGCQPGCAGTGCPTTPPPDAGPSCGAVGDACSTSTNCCQSLSCQGGVCASCIPYLADCESDSPCCSGSCATVGDGPAVCGNPTCTQVDGATCSVNADCCQTPEQRVCLAGTCVAPACIEPNQLCVPHRTPCCSGTCTGNFVQTGGVAFTCTFDEPR
jgi:hypothetical protein